MPFRYCLWYAFAAFDIIFTLIISLLFRHWCRYHYYYDDASADFHYHYCLLYAIIFVIFIDYHFDYHWLHFISSSFSRHAIDYITIIIITLFLSHYALRDRLPCFHITLFLSRRLFHYADIFIDDTAFLSIRHFLFIFVISLFDYYCAIDYFSPCWLRRWYWCWCWWCFHFISYFRHAFISFDYFLRALLLFHFHWYWCIFHYFISLSTLCFL